MIWEQGPYFAGGLKAETKNVVIKGIVGENIKYMSEYRSQVPALQGDINLPNRDFLSYGEKN